ncbi:MAG TPA: hypothetical protein VLF40_05310 [Candidatus Saccharimonadales bacterium]|nr:hypothetical protein [Candidatus Saccharimonadales bacterium]
MPEVPADTPIACTKQAMQQAALEAGVGGTFFRRATPERTESVRARDLDELVEIADEVFTETAAAITEAASGTSGMQVDVVGHKYRLYGGKLPAMNYHFVSRGSLVPDGYYLVAEVEVAPTDGELPADSSNPFFNEMELLLRHRKPVRGCRIRDDNAGQYRYRKVGDLVTATRIDIDPRLKHRKDGNGPFREL